MALRIGYLVGWLLIAAALLALGGDFVASLAAGEFSFALLGAVWFNFDNASLNLVQAVVQRYISPWLWDPVIQWILSRPATLVAAVPGAALLYFCRDRGPRRPRRKSTFD